MIIIRADYLIRLLFYAMLLMLMLIAAYFTLFRHVVSPLMPMAPNITAMPPLFIDAAPFIAA